jgi:uncharacterized membrane protein
LSVGVYLTAPGGGIQAGRGKGERPTTIQAMGGRRFGRRNCLGTHTPSRRGAEDFAAIRTDVSMLCLVYPFAGLLLAWLAFSGGLIALVFPLVAGFALVGPVAAMGLCELSRRREAGQKANWGDAFGFLSRPSLAPILVLGAYLVALFVAWMIVTW